MALCARCQVLFYIWRMKAVLKAYQVAKYYEQDCCYSMWLVYYKEWYTYDVHENCPIFKNPHPLSMYVRNSFTPFTLTSNFKRTHLSKWYRACERTNSKQKKRHVTFKLPRVLLFDLAHKQCNVISKGWLHCLRS